MKIILSSYMDTIIGAVIAIVITWFFAFFYYRKASKELIKETEKLRKLIQAILRAFEHQGIEFVKNEKGEYTGGMKINLSGKVNINSLTKSAELEID